MLARRSRRDRRMVARSCSRASTTADSDNVASASVRKPKKEPDAKPVNCLSSATARFEASLFCPQGHQLTAFTTDLPGYSCTHCLKEFRSGTSLRCCRPCDYDVCSDCLVALWPAKTSKDEAFDELPGLLPRRIPIGYRPKTPVVLQRSSFAAEDMVVPPTPNGLRETADGELRSFASPSVKRSLREDCKSLEAFLHHRKRSRSVLSDIKSEPSELAARALDLAAAMIPDASQDPALANERAQHARALALSLAMELCEPEQPPIGQGTFLQAYHAQKSLDEWDPVAKPDVDIKCKRPQSPIPASQAVKLEVVEELTHRRHETLHPKTPLSPPRRQELLRPKVPLSPAQRPVTLIKALDPKTPPDKASPNRSLERHLERFSPQRAANPQRRSKTASPRRPARRSRTKAPIRRKRKRAPRTWQYCVAPSSNACGSLQDGAAGAATKIATSIFDKEDTNCVSRAGPVGQIACPGCHAPMRWSDYAEGDYDEGWQCNSAIGCNFSEADCGAFRYFCQPCANDICTACAKTFVAAKDTSSHMQRGPRNALLS